MGGGSPLPITITEMDTYYEIFQPIASKKHFMRVVRAADKVYLEVTSEDMKRKSKSKGKPDMPEPKGGNSPSGNTFPAAPTPTK